MEMQIKSQHSFKAKFSSNLKPGREKKEILNRK